MLVDSCYVFCQPIISPDHIENGHILLTEFCKLFESLYGPECCTPNMHMACHLKDCLLDFGPFLSFWCFPYERYNGILEGVRKSWILPEKQMFLKFLGMQHVKLLIASKCCDENFLAVVYEEVHSKTKDDYSSFGQSQVQDVVMMQQVNNFSCNVSMIDAEKKDYQFLIPPFKEKYFCDSELLYLHELYSCLYPTMNIVHVSRFYKEYKKCVINCEEYTSSNSRSQRSTAIAVRWPNLSRIDTQGEEPPKIGHILSFIDHSIIVSSNLDHHNTDSTSSTTKSHILVRLQWYGDHPRRNFLHSSVLLCSTLFDPESCASFMPISRIMCRCAVSSPLSLPNI